MKCSQVLILLAGAIARVFADESCGVVPMSQWAGELTLRTQILRNPVGLVVIQHTVTSEATTDSECEGIARSIRKYHTKILKFDDIGQSFLICGNGRVYEGAGWARIGAHTKSFNKKSLGVSFIGDFSSTQPTLEAINAAKNLLSCGVKNGHLSEDYKIIGHRQVSNTQSPGDELQKEIETWPQWSSQQA